MSAVENFIYDYEGTQREVMFYLHHMLTADFELTSKIRYKIPFYYRKTWVCYLNPSKQGGVDFSFIRGNELSNEQGILDFKDRKQVSSIELLTIDDIPHDALYEILQEALLLDETVPYSVRKKK